MVSMEGHKARCEANRVQHDVSFALLSAQAASVGDHVLARRGYTIETIAADYANTAWDRLDAAALGSIPCMDEIARRLRTPDGRRPEACCDTRP
jgi:hydrogenase maturation factor